MASRRKSSSRGAIDCSRSGRPAPPSMSNASSAAGAGSIARPMQAVDAWLARRACRRRLGHRRVASPGHRDAAL